MRQWKIPDMVVVKKIFNEILRFYLPEMLLETISMISVIYPGGSSFCLTCENV